MRTINENAAIIESGYGLSHDRAVHYARLYAMLAKGEACGDDMPPDLWGPDGWGRLLEQDMDDEVVA